MRREGSAALRGTKRGPTVVRQLKNRGQLPVVMCVIRPRGCSPGPHGVTAILIRTEDEQGSGHICAVVVRQLLGYETGCTPGN